MSHEHDARINSTLARVAAKRGFQQEAVTTYTPLAALLSREEGDDEEAMRIKIETFNRFIDYCMQNGPHPGAVMRNFYALVHALRPEAALNMTCKEHAMLFGQTKAAHSWRVKQIFTGYLKESGAKAFKAGFQKSEVAVESYRRQRLGKTKRGHGLKKAA